MGEGLKIDAAALASLFKDKIANAEGTKIAIEPGEFKIVDLDEDKSQEKWTIVGGSTVVPSDLEIAINLSPETSMIELLESDVDKNLFALKVKHGGFQLKLLSKNQGLSVDMLDDDDACVSHVELDPDKSGFNRHYVDLEAHRRAMVYLGPTKYPIRVFQRQQTEDEKSIRLVFNPSIPKE